MIALAGAPLVHYPPIGGSDPTVESKTVFFATLLALLALLRALGILTGARRESPGFRTPAALALAWAAVSAISLSRQDAPALFFRQSLLQWAFLLWVWLLAGVASPARWIERHLTALALAGIIVGLGGLAQALFPREAERWLPYAGSFAEARHAIFSTLGNPEYLGGFLAVIAVLCFAFALREPFHWPRLMWWPAMALALCVMALTGARGAWLGCLCGLAIFAGMELAARKARAALVAALVAGIAVAAGAAAVFSVPNPLNPFGVSLWSRLKGLGDSTEESIRHRVAMGAVGARLIQEHFWLGVGPGRFPVEYYRGLEAMRAEDDTGAVASYLELLQGRTPDHAHNDALEFWIETGLLGFALFAALLGWGLTEMRRGAFVGDPRAWGVRAALALCVVLLVGSLFNFPLHLPARGTVFWTLLILGGRAGTELWKSR